MGIGVARRVQEIIVKVTLSLCNSQIPKESWAMYSILNIHVKYVQRGVDGGGACYCTRRWLNRSWQLLLNTCRSL